MIDLNTKLVIVIPVVPVQEHHRAGSCAGISKIKKDSGILKKLEPGIKKYAEVAL